MSLQVVFCVLLRFYPEQVASTSRCSRTTRQEPCDTGAVVEPHNEHRLRSEMLNEVQAASTEGHMVTLSEQHGEAVEMSRVRALRAGERAPRAGRPCVDGSCAPSSRPCPTPQRAALHGPPHTRKSFVRMSSAKKNTILD